MHLSPYILPPSPRMMRGGGGKEERAHIGLKMTSANVKRIVRDITFLSPADVTCALDSSLFCEMVFVVILIFVGRHGEGATCKLKVKPKFSVAA